jgi:hypothetical protein
VIKQEGLILETIETYSLHIFRRTIAAVQLTNLEGVSIEGIDLNLDLLRQFLSPSKATLEKITLNNFDLSHISTFFSNRWQTFLQWIEKEGFEKCQYVRIKHLGGPNGENTDLVFENGVGRMASAGQP